jgi:hypothetical protein
MSHRLAPIIIAATVAAAGCGGNADKPTSATPATTSAVARAPYGLYVRTVSKHDIARTAKLRDEHGVNPSESAPPAGRYRLVIAKGGAQDVIKVTDPAGFTVDMDMNIKPGSLHMTSYVNPARSAFCGPEVPEQAAYSFRSAGDSLTLRPQTTDECADRDSLLTGTWDKD